MAFKIQYTEATSSGGASVYYAVIINNDGLYYNPTTELYEAYSSPGANFANAMTNSEDVLYTVSMPDYFATVHGVVKIYKRSGGSPNLTTDRCVSINPMVYRTDVADVVDLSAIFDYCQRLLPVLNGSSSAGLQIIGPVQYNSLNATELIASVVNGADTNNTPDFPPDVLT